MGVSVSLECGLASENDWPAGLGPCRRRAGCAYSGASAIAASMATSTDANVSAGPALSSDRCAHSPQR